MIKKLVSIDGIGLFREAEGGGKLNFEEVTLIYGENACGKSTLASILNSAAQNDPSLLISRQTIGVPVGQKVHIRIDNKDIRFEGGKWSGPTEHLRVFNSDFIEQMSTQATRLVLTIVETS